MKRAILISLAIVSVLAGCHRPHDRQGDITGIWTGKIKTPTRDICLYYRLSRAPDGELAALFDNPLYGIKDVPVDVSSHPENRYFLSASLFRMTYDGQFDADSGKAEGTFTCVGGPLPLILTRIDEDPAALQPYMVPRLGSDGELETDYTYRIPVSVSGGWPVASAVEVGISTGGTRLG